MKAIIKDATYGEIVYNESSMTGRKTITINGVKLDKLDGKTYQYKTEDGQTKLVNLQGNFFMGAKLVLDGKTFQLTQPIKWYEIALIVLQFALLLTWSMIPQCLFIIPIVGGAIGGGFYGVLAFLNLYIMKMTDKVWAKILIWLGITLASFLIGYLLALLIGNFIF